MEKCPAFLTSKVLTGLDWFVEILTGSDRIRRLSCADCLINIRYQITAQKDIRLLSVSILRFCFILIEFSIEKIIKKIKLLMLIVVLFFRIFIREKCLHCYRVFQ